MSGLFDKQSGADFITIFCKPLQRVLTNHSIGRFLQFFHLFAYIALLFLTLFYPATRLVTLTIFAIVLFMFYAFDGCILTRAEIEFLGKFETVPGLALDAFGLRPTDKETDKYLQKVGSIAALVVPIIFILAVGTTKINTNSKL
jgi:hypothetical protein